ncbi:hypothetical protein ACWDO7_22805 [Streptomyces sp. NPDC003656]
MSHTPDARITPDHALSRMPADKALRRLNQEPRTLAATFAYAADRIEALPQDYELDPGRGDAVGHLRRWAEAARPDETDVSADDALANLADAVSAGRDCLAMAVLFARQWNPHAPVGLHQGIDEILATMPDGAPRYDFTRQDLIWTGTLTEFPGRGLSMNAVIEGITAQGVRTGLTVKSDDRFKLAALLDQVFRGAPCGTAGCGSTDDWDASDPKLLGWLRLEIAGLDGGPRWYCAPECVSHAIARARDELAALDDLDARYGVGAADEYSRQLAEATADGFADAHADDSEDGTR